MSLLEKLLKRLIKIDSYKFRVIAFYTIRHKVILSKPAFLIIKLPVIYFPWSLKALSRWSVRLISASTSLMKTLCLLHSTTLHPPHQSWFPFLCLAVLASGSMEGRLCQWIKMCLSNQKEKGSRAQCGTRRGCHGNSIYALNTHYRHRDAHTPYTTPCISVINYSASDWPPGSKSTRHSSLFNHLSYHSYLCLSNHDLLHYRYTVNRCWSWSTERAVLSQQKHL